MGVLWLAMGPNMVHLGSVRVEWGLARGWVCGLVWGLRCGFRLCSWFWTIELFPLYIYSRARVVVGFRVRGLKMTEMGTFGILDTEYSRIPVDTLKAREGLKGALKGGVSRAKRGHLGVHLDPWPR